jgi:hypothetical protein
MEAWSQLGGQHSNEMINMIGHLSNHLRESKFIFVLVIPPPLYHGYTTLFSSISIRDLTNYLFALEMHQECSVTKILSDW